MGSALDIVIPEQTVTDAPLGTERATTAAEAVSLEAAVIGNDAAPSGRAAEPPRALQEGQGGERGTGTSPPSPPPVRPFGSGAATSAQSVYTPAPAVNPVIVRLREEELYRQSRGDGRHDVECPWSPEHPIGGDFSASYREPDLNHPRGTFSCSCPKHRGYGMEALLDALEIEPVVATGKAVIRAKQGEMYLVVDAAERLLAAEGSYYQSGNQIVRLRRNADTGDVTAEPLNDGALAKALSAEACWLKWDGRKQDYVPTDPPHRYVTTLLRSREFPHLPNLRGIARQPYILADGKLVETAGYDPDTETFGAFSPERFPLPVPTRGAAEEALAAIKSLIAEFHFHSEADRSAALCAMLTASMRSQLPLAPAFNISASASGSGKSYLAGIVSLFAGPRQPMNVSFPVRADEANKAIMTALMTRPAVVLFDDMQTNWIAHGIINRMLTSETISDRLLGGNEAAVVPTTTLVMGTGNNVEPERDLRRRVVSVYLSPSVDTPATISYEGRPLDKMRQNRGEYVSHALTIVRAWIAADRPTAKVPEIASFGTWSETCRQPLIWLGEQDPATSLIQQVQSDPDLELLATMLRGWHEEFGLKSAMLRTIVDRAEGNSDGDLWQAMLDMPFMDARGVNRSKFGQYLKRNANRVAGGLRVVKVDNSERNAWAVVPVGREPSGYEGKGARGWQPAAKGARASTTDSEIY